MPSNLLKDGKMKMNQWIPTAAPIGSIPDSPGLTISVHAPEHRDRFEVEQFITGVYRSAFDAEPSVFTPQLVALRDAEGRIIAAVGFRAASDGALFLEHYLDQPAEQLIARGAAESTARCDVVEVGHLCAVQAGAGRSLAVWLATHLARSGFRWVVGTLTRELRHLFLRMGVVARVLNPATPEAIGDQAARWGRYYEHQPLVLAASLEQVSRMLQLRGGVR
jgi:hypothetical protein